MLRKIDLSENEALNDQLLSRSGGIDAQVTAAAQEIIDRVRDGGDGALRELTREFDGVTLDELRVDEKLIDEAVGRIDSTVAASLQKAADAILSFHEKQVRQSWFTTRPDGVMLGTQIVPLSSVGIYVPGGRAQYPSTVLMNAIPAQVAGVARIAMAVPPLPDGSIDPHTLAAAKIAGVREIYRVGGAQAIAAFAYGTGSIERVDKITGPGNAYVAAAKKLVSGDVGIDMIAGPSEVLILADETAEPGLVAIDLMAQAEHDPRAACYLVTTDPGLPALVEESLALMLDDSSRADITRASLTDNALVVVCPDTTAALEAANFIAPEHLEVMMDEPLELLGSIRNAGAIFLGPWTPESVGDYIAGPNHTLPTGGTARFASPLGVDDFCKKSSVLAYSYAGLLADADAVMDIAGSEGLWAHGRAVSLRLEMADYYAQQEEERD